MHRRETCFGAPSFSRAVAVFLVANVGVLWGQDLDETRKLFLAGKYEDCIRECEKTESRQYRNEEWPCLQARSLLTLGRYPEAETVVSNALERASSSVRLRLLSIETAHFAAQTNVSQSRLREINQLVVAKPWGYREPADLVALGQAALAMGADPKTVLDRLYVTAQKADSSFRDAWIASGELALEKHDFALAAKTFAEAQKKFPDDPEVLYGLAAAFQPNARGKMVELLETALTKNERHVPSILLLADHAVDAEEYEAAEQLLARVLKVNPWQPKAWAYRAVLAHLQNRPTQEQLARGNALKYWTANPEVDHLIGLKLSQKYRFTEGAAYQRRSLEFNPDYLPARMQLAEDLLRLGQETEGWRLAEEVHKADGYDVTAYNLVTLHGTMQKYQTLTNADFILRMNAHEAALYGDRALALLARAKSNLMARYGILLPHPTTVEIFPEQKDFGVRTFGMPHNPGFLGVCFGHVITANSPASQAGHPANWEAVLWHEFCHVVTLQLTKNKMPRWLSEGISVYEEMQANPLWGQTMNPRYREMVLGDDLTPVTELSSAFMSPKSDLHVQFAYYESSLVVDYLVSTFGFDKLKAILVDLGQGLDINEAISKHTAPLKQVEKEFVAFAKAKAEALGPGLDWEKPKDPTALMPRLGLDAGRPKRGRPRATTEDSPGTNQSNKAEDSLQLSPLLLSQQATNRPATAQQPSISKPSERPNYWALMEQATKLISEQHWQEAKVPLQTLIEQYPNQNGPNNAFALLASIHRELKEAPEERRALEQWANTEADALDAYLRLMELAEQSQDWKAVTQNAERTLAVNPLLPQPYRQLARAGEVLQDAPIAIRAYQRLLLLDPADPAEVHFRLALLMRANNDPAARRHVLQALEEAPRYRGAHHLLLELARANPPSTNAPASPGLPQ